MVHFEHSRKHSLVCRAFVSSLIVGALVAFSAACGGDDEASADPKTSCDSMCKKTGFTGSNVSDEGHEVNCFCQGSGTVTDEACTSMCQSLGKTGKPFRSGSSANNACQCE